MPQNSAEQCLSCRGTDLIDGRFGAKRMTFIPDGRFMFLGYATTATLCLDCGFVATKVGRDPIAKIKEKRLGR